MAETSAISWTKSTFNPWIGCTKVGPGCDHCYAEALDVKRFSKMMDGGTPEEPVHHWGRGAPRHRTSAQNWSAPRKWNRKAPESVFVGRKGFWPVFCASLADVGDNEVPSEWRQDLWMLIINTPNLTWQLVTKRVGNVMKMVPHWWTSGHWPANVWIIATMVNQEEFDRDWPKLRALPASVRGISVEPMLGPIKFPEDARGALNWVIYGGESNQGQGLENARACDTEWIEDGIRQCRALGIAPFVKQLGARPYDSMEKRHFTRPDDRANADPANWPEALRVQEFPAALLT